MMLFQVSYDRFIREIEVEKIKPGDRNVLEKEDLGNGFAYYLNSLDRHQTYVFVVGKEEFSSFSSVQKSNLDAMSMPSKRIKEEEELKNISETLNRIEENSNKLPKETIIEREVIKEE